MDLINKIKEDSKFLLALMAILAGIVLLFFFFWAGLVLLFFIAFIIWIGFFIAYFKYLFQISWVFRVVIFVVLLVLTLGLLYKAAPDRFQFGKRANPKGEVVNGITLVPCSRTLADKPTKLPGLNTDLYSAPLTENSADPEDANNVRTFSLAGLNNKTEKNSFFSHFDMADGSTIQGYDDGMEVCNADNKTNVSYNIAGNDDSDIVEEANVTGRTHYFHGGKYIAEPGTYRVDQFVRDKADGQWKLVNRVEGITITE